MKNIFLNISNHPSATWTAEQVGKAEQEFPTHHDRDCDRDDSGWRDPVEIIDVPFPAIGTGTADSAMEADLLLNKINRMLPYVDGKPDFIANAMVMGEMVTVCHLVPALQAAGISCFASITRRESIDEPQPDGSVKKTAVFRFCGFRKFPSLKSMTPTSDGD